MLLASLDDWHELRYQRPRERRELQPETLYSIDIHVGQHASLIASICSQFLMWKKLSVSRKRTFLMENGYWLDEKLDGEAGGGVGRLVAEVGDIQVQVAPENLIAVVVFAFGLEKCSR